MPHLPHAHVRSLVPTCDSAHNYQTDHLAFCRPHQANVLCFAREPAVCCHGCGEG